MLQDSIDIISRRRKVLGRLGRSSKFLQTLLHLGTAAAELHHASKSVLSVISSVYERLQEQDTCDSLILELAECMAKTLMYIEDVEQFARLAQVETALKDIHPLMEDTTNFILKYTSFGKTDHDLVHELKLRFERFKQQFDRGVLVQSVSTIPELLAYLCSSEDDAVLSELKPKDIDRGSPHAECMSGTRQDILEQIDIWMADMHVPNILWMKGHPGVGKSAIASSVVERLTEARRLGSSFFFQRDRATVTTPHALWRRVAFDLGCQYPTIRRSLVAKLENGEVPPTTVNVDKIFQHFIREPLLESGGIPGGRLPVVVVDALDECGGLEGQISSHRESLMQTLERWPGFPKEFKLIVTSRDEADIRRMFEKTKHQIIEIVSGRMVNSQSSKDINSFLTTQFQRIAEGIMMDPAEWPGTHVVNELTLRAAGLFIWARTIIRFVALGDPDEQLNLILEGSGTGDMGELYSRMLQISFPKPTSHVTSAFKAILGTTILARTPLSASTIADLLSIKFTTMNYICGPLGCVLEWGETLHIIHQSYSDFLVDTNACPPNVLVELKETNRRITLACLNAMRTGLRFNICDIKSSHVQNSDMIDLDLRIKQRVPPHLQYSCFFWVDHLVESSHDTEIMDLVKGFMDNHFLFWLEVLSLCKRVNVASSILSLLAEWFPDDRKGATLASDMKKFVMAFAGPISESVPHIYLAALPFAPVSSIVSRKYRHLFPKTLIIESGEQGAWPSIQHVLHRHTRLISSVTFSPDGKRIASGSHDKTIVVWDSETGEVIADFLAGYADWVTSVAFSPNGKLIASGSYDSTIVVWDIDTRRIIGGPLRGHTDPVTSIAFSPDGKRIASGSYDRTIRVWDSETAGIVMNPLRGHTDCVIYVAFSLDGKQIVSGGYDNTIRVWSSETGKMITGLFQCNVDLVTSVASAPDGKRVAFGSNDTVIQVWDREKGRIVTGLFEGHTKAITSVAFSSDGRYIASGSYDNTVIVWDSRTGEVIAGPFKGHTHRVMSVAFSPNNKRIISGSQDEAVYVWDIEAKEFA
ncbi:hypothetical protein CPB86DRAFT_45312, partial [Serendipita vermifera]